MDSKGNVWQEDANFSGGGIYSQAAAVTGTLDPALFQTIRYAQPGNNFIYTFPVPNGPYTVNLSFAELWLSSIGRTFKVQVNGTVVLNNFDVYAKAGENVADVETVGVKVNSGSIVIELDALSGNGFLDAIEILPMGAPQTIPVTLSFPGSGSGQGFTLTVNAVTVPSCNAATDGDCSLQIQICLPDGTTCLTGVGTLSLVKTVTLPTPQTQTTIIANVKSP